MFRTVAGTGLATVSAPVVRQPGGHHRTSAAAERFVGWPRGARTRRRHNIQPKAAIPWRADRHAIIDMSQAGNTTHA
jgi:hypothetical protein